jgi:hypothetical protein
VDDPHAHDFKSHGHRSVNFAPSHRAADDSRTLSRSQLWLLGFGVWTLCLAVTSGRYYAYDAQSMAAVTRSLVERRTLITTGEFSDSFGFSTPYSPYGLGLSLLLVPFYLLVRLVGGTDNFILSLCNPILITLCSVLIAKTGQALEWPKLRSLIAAVSFAAATMALQSSTELFSEPAVSLCLMVIFWSALRWRTGVTWAPLVIGIASAAALQVRSDAAFTVWPLALIAIIACRSALTRRSLATLAIYPTLSTALLIWYNEVRFQRPFVSNYGGQGFHTPLLHGLYGFLLSPGKSLFLFNPIALLAIPGIVILARRNLYAASLISIAAVTRIGLYARWDSWDGGWCWGPRFLLPIVPLLVIAAFETFSAVPHRSFGRKAVVSLAAALLAAGSMVSYLSVRVPYWQWYSAMAVPEQRVAYGINERVGAAPGTQTRQPSDEYNFVAAVGPINGDILLLQRGTSEMAPYWWRSEGLAAIGWALLLVATFALTLTLGTSRRRVDTVIAASAAEATTS